MKWNISIEIHSQATDSRRPKVQFKTTFPLPMKTLFQEKVSTKNNKKGDWLSIEENFQKINMKSKNSWKKMKCSRGSSSLESKWKMSTEKRGSGAQQTERLKMWKHKARYRAGVGPGAEDRSQVKDYTQNNQPHPQAPPLNRRTSLDTDIYQQGKQKFIP